MRDAGGSVKMAAVERVRSDSISVHFEGKTNRFAGRLDEGELSEREGSNRTPKVCGLSK